MCYDNIIGVYMSRKKNVRLKKKNMFLFIFFLLILGAGCFYIFKKWNPVSVFDSKKVGFLGSETNTISLYELKKEEGEEEAKLVKDLDIARGTKVKYSDKKETILEEEYFKI